MGRRMVMDKKHGQIRLLIRVSISLERNTVMEHLLGGIGDEKESRRMICQISVNVMWGNFKMINFMERVNMSG